ncbi:hypothetical protein LX16_4969 [Stackebrandtia albiflava]|uniref:DSBA-like thioredoxin domain-containing protein n=1 Tax=Stackebrandtia albiflava TaxID=406432 RepID=A0A562UQ99_9ACTN|nr:disulfide bond formation protein DsbA [Stackebrandtia albiflava]TWJ07805.1 hypothetical protein LX16_4969 [Stackebrandtia albiflava]
MQPVDLWFDPSCPYTWVTSRWLVEVTQVRPVELRWHVMSLSVLNEHREVDPEGDTEGYLWMPVRICAAVAHDHGQRGLGDFYTALGRRLHEGGEWDPDVIPTALAEAGLPVELAEAGTSERYDAAVRRSHAAGIGLVGDHVGTPIVATERPDGTRVAFFGPVISRSPHGEAAGRLWDAVVEVAGTPGFAELKGPPPEPPQPTSA